MSDHPGDEASSLRLRPLEGAYAALTFGLVAGFRSLSCSSDLLSAAEAFSLAIKRHRWRPSGEVERLIEAGDLGLNLTAEIREAGRPAIEAATAGSALSAIMPEDLWPGFAMLNAAILDNAVPAILISAYLEEAGKLGVGAVLQGIARSLRAA